jgi:hypothetical protein
MASANESNARLAALAHALRSLHRVLAERVRRDVEAERQTEIQPGAWLAMLTRDAQFAWLRSLSELIVDVDVFLEADPAPAEDDAASIRAEIERLIAPSAVPETQTEFARHYWRYVHDAPEVAVAHGEIRQAIDRLPKPADVDEGDALHERHRWAEVRRHRG